MNCECKASNWARSQMVNGAGAGCDGAFEMIRQHVQDRSMLHFPGHKRQILKSRLEERLVELNLPDFNSYLETLRLSSREESVLLDMLTVNETFFFRNRSQFRFLMEQILPLMEEKKGRQVLNSWGSSRAITPGSVMKLRILCAGCSTGEEPYSVAMALLESLRYPRAWKIEILAVDLSESCIRKAASGFFEEDRLRGLPLHLRDKYLDCAADGGYRVKEEVKNLVRFRQFNLGRIIDNGKLSVSEDKFSGFDLIFCRNVMIYFPFEMQQRLVRALYDALVPGGYLFTGDAEALHIHEHQFMTVDNADCLIYRKDGGSEE